MIGEDAVADRLTETFRAEWPRLVAAATRLLGDLQAGEDVVQDVLLAALDRWPLTGVPANPAGWLMTACRNRARDVLRDTSRARDRIHALIPLQHTTLSAGLRERVDVTEARQNDLHVAGQGRVSRASLSRAAGHLWPRWDGPKLGAFGPTATA